MVMITDTELRDAIKLGLAKAGKRIIEDARDAIPKRTGRARRGLKVGIDKGDKLIMRLGWPRGPYYSYFLEFGRKASAKRTRPGRARALRIGNTGQVRASARGSSLPAGKYLEKAIKSQQGQKAIEDEIAKQVAPLFKDIIIGPHGARFK